MKSSTKHLPPADPASALSARHGHDEMNFAEFPLVLLAKRAPAGMHSIEYQDDYSDAKGKLITRKVTISGAGKYGLPTAQDEDVLIALMYVTLLDKHKIQQNDDASAGDPADNRTIYFTRPQLFQILGWPDTGDNYERLKKSLRRWKGVTIIYENWAFLINNGERHRTDETGFSLLDNYELSDSRSRLKDPLPPTLPFPDLPFQRSRCSITWNKTPFSSFKSGFLKKLDLDKFFRLPTPAAKRAFRYLDKNLPAAGPQEYDLERFACQHVGFSSKYKPGRLRQDVQQTVVQPLEQENFIAPMPVKDRFLKRDGRYRVIFARARQELLPAPSDHAPAEQPAATAPSPILNELKRRGLGGKVARDVVAVHSADYIEQKIEFLDHMLAAGAVEKPAAWLRRAIEEDYGPPAGYVPRAERERQNEVAEEKQRQRDQTRQEAEEAKRAEQQRAEAEAKRRRAHIDACLAALTEADRQALIERVLAQAVGLEAEFARKPGIAGDAIRQGLIDNEVLRVHPLPAPQT